MSPRKDGAPNGRTGSAAATFGLVVETVNTTTAANLKAHLALTDAHVVLAQELKVHGEWRGMLSQNG